MIRKQQKSYIMWVKQSTKKYSWETLKDLRGGTVESETIGCPLVLQDCTDTNSPIKQLIQLSNSRKSDKAFPDDLKE